jgi:hypothetical protein
MKRFVQSRGYAGEGYRALSLEELLALRSPIVPIEVRGDPHFVVVRGQRGREIELADPAFGNRSMPIEEFSAAWQDGIGFAITREP